MDFVADALFDGRKLRALAVVDNYATECLGIEVGPSLKGEDVVQVLEAIRCLRGGPQTIKVDNGTAFISKAMDGWDYEYRVELHFSRPDCPTNNAQIQSFNGRLRQEYLSEHWFLSPADAQWKIEACRRHYNESRPRTALAWLRPRKFSNRAR